MKSYQEGKRLEEKRSKVISDHNQMDYNLGEWFITNDPGASKRDQHDKHHGPSGLMTGATVFSSPLHEGLPGVSHQMTLDSVVQS